MGENIFPYKIIKEIESGVKDDESLETGWYMGVNLYIIFDGSKFGVAYNKYNDFPNKKAGYVVLIDCIWDHIDILDTEFGDYVVVYSGGKCGCYSLYGDIKECESSDYVTYYTSLNAMTICECLYDSVKYDKGRCERAIFLTCEDGMQYYDLKCEIMSEYYSWVSAIDNEFLECCQNDQITRFHLDKEAIFPQLPEQELVHYVCNYKDGIVYNVVTNRNCEENQWEGYLLFYSKTDGLFYYTEVYDKINLFGVSESCGKFQMSGFEAISNSVDITYHSFGKYWSDKDVKKANCICVCENAENKPNTHKTIDLGICGTQHVE